MAAERVCAPGHLPGQGDICPRQGEGLWVTGVFPVDLSIRNPAEQISEQEVPEKRLLTPESSTGPS